MTTSEVLLLLLIGAVAGGLSGMLGIGGGVLVIPGLIFLCGFPHPRAVGTSLAMLLPPIGIFAVVTYFKSGMVDVRAAGVMAIAFALAAWGGAVAVRRGWIPEQGLRLLFCAFLLYVAGNMLFRSDRRVWAALSVVILLAGYSAGYILLKLLARRLERFPSASELYRERMARRGPVPMDYEI